jgi:hypothetical protein
LRVVIAASPSVPKATVEFSGDSFPVSLDEPLLIGRGGALDIDDNPYLHRNFLRVAHGEGLWWLANTGTTLTATIADEEGLMQAWLAPGAQLPLVFERSVVWFTAGSTTYELDIVLDNPPFQAIAVRAESSGGSGSTTVGRVVFTPDQKRLVLGLCEPMLRHGVRGRATIPSSAEAAARLGWSLTRFNRKLDNVCEKLTRAGVRGLHGEPGKLAVSRRARLVEYALAARLVERSDMYLLDEHSTVDDDGFGEG